MKVKVGTDCSKNCNGDCSKRDKDNAKRLSHIMSNAGDMSAIVISMVCSESFLDSLATTCCIIEGIAERAGANPKDIAKYIYKVVCEANS